MFIRHGLFQCYRRGINAVLSNLVKEVVSGNISGFGGEGFAGVQAPGPFRLNILRKGVIFFFFTFSAPALWCSSKSYSYIPGVGVGMQNVRANVKVLEF